MTFDEAETYIIWWVLNKYPYIGVAFEKPKKYKEAEQILGKIRVMEIYKDLAPRVNELRREWRKNAKRN